MSTVKKGLNIAIEGCGHGALDQIYATMKQLEAQTGKAIDLLICCGDFQAVRNLDDLECMACPPKYREMNTYWRYYKGEAQAPYPTLFIGGNHEAANHLTELLHGGWVAPNIMYLGHAGVINFGGVRIGGLSGIYDARDYRKGHFEFPPYSPSSIRSAYHVRELDVYRLAMLRPGKMDVFLSHDWPQGVEHHGNLQWLLDNKPYFRKDIETGALGSPPAMQLLRALRPAHWFSAHLHIKYPAVVPHAQGEPTKFLSLDKCLPKRHFLQIVSFPEATGAPVFNYDAEWLAILRATHDLASTAYAQKALPAPIEAVAGRGPPDQELAWIDRRLSERAEGRRVPENFVRTAPTYDPARDRRGAMPAWPGRNPQTVAFLDLLGLEYNLDPPAARGSGGGPMQGHSYSRSPLPSPMRTPPTAATPNPEEIDLDALAEDDSMFDHVTMRTAPEGEAGPLGGIEGEDEDGPGDGKRRKLNFPGPRPGVTVGRVLSPALALERAAAEGAAAAEGPGSTS